MNIFNAMIISTNEEVLKTQAQDELETIEKNRELARQLIWKAILEDEENGYP